MKIVICCLIFFSACASIQRATLQGQIADAWTQISDKDYVRTRGIGVASTKSRGVTRRRGQSRSAALVNARYNLLALIKGVRLSGGVTVAQLIERDSLIREIADEVVAGGEEVLTEWTKDGGCVVTLELKRSLVERLIQEKSDRERGLERRVAQDMDEIQRLGEALGRALRSPVVKMDRCDIEAIKGKAAHLELLENMLRQVSPTDYSGIYMLNNAIAWVKEEDVVAKAEAMRRMTGCDFTPVRELDKLAENMRIINRYIRGETTGLEGWVK